ncbi:hypothetical protein OD91_2572 [Lutibacter sp. Hel_I_33_5]|uniref:T9SS type A sorting domain-containing protein n=1 Tax=Lutibacter sp. Hel_I_33_5 TaxID=1566289 RepID=UPI0011A34074|nr:T9SS type A sorting domain-containing protein [Lutibacter sp. Hel_I_33_5]TVZ57254.1 hypothetical protein OD91_2572 [Lutibacter sp. Hel_I_33_5]
MKIKLLICLTYIGFLCLSSFSQTIYVDITASGSNNGTSWVNAYTNIQDGVNAISTGGEILIAAGTYKQGAEITINKALTLKGGYPTGGGTQDITNNATILDGNTTHRVLSATHTTGTLFLEGLTIQKGHANNHGAGIYATGTLDLQQVVVSTNQTTITSSNTASLEVYGGGIHGTNITVTNSRITSNNASAYNNAGNPLPMTSNAYGGGIYGTNITVTNSQITHNSTLTFVDSAQSNFNSFGGGIYGTNITVINSKVASNNAFSSMAGSGINVSDSSRGGGIYGAATITLTNSLVTNNSVASVLYFFGGGVYGTTILQNSILWDNTKREFSNANFIPSEHESGTLTANYSLIKTQNPAGTANIDATVAGFNPLFVDEANGNYSLQTCSPLKNSGNDSYNATTQDLDGNTRKVGTIDIGPYEYSLSNNGINIIYVDITANGSNNGGCWANAYNSLQDAIAAATAGSEIWVAKGTYTPDVGVNVTLGDRNASFVMKNNVGIYGGFNGTETLRTQRDWENNTTILSGDIGILNTETDNSKTIIKFENLDATPVLDGFTITKAYGTETLGGGLYIDESSPTISNCIITNNKSKNGAAIYTRLENPVFKSCTISFNHALPNGNAVVYTNANDTFINCKFIGNSSNYASGGAILKSSNDSKAINCFFDDNTGYTAGVILRGGGSFDFTNCTFTNNRSLNNVGTVAFGSGLTFVNSILWGNIGGSKINGTISYSILQDDTEDGTVTFPSGVTDGGHNLDRNPNLVEGYKELPCISPSINSGNNAAPNLSGITTDIDGNPRIYEGTVDIGVFEFQQDKNPTFNFPDDIIYVNKNATGANNGSSWVNAFTKLYDALFYINGCGATASQIWVAKGTYITDDSFFNNVGDRNNHFKLPNISIYGGFAGNEAPTFNLNTRDLQANETILSGNIGNEISNTDNTYTVVIANNLNNITIDGFTIRDGYGTSPKNGGGIQILNCNNTVTFKQLKITNNNSARYGGGVYISNSQSNITHSLIKDNFASSKGGAMYTTNSSPNLSNITFSGNTANIAGGMYNNNSSPSITNTTFSGNTATVGGGGGILNAESSSPNLINTTFSGNTANYGGGMYNDYTSSPNLINTTFSGNTANYGGGMYNEFPSSSPTLYNTVLYGNGTDIVNGSGATIHASSANNFSQNFTGTSFTTLTADPFKNSVDPDGTDNIFSTPDDGFVPAIGSPLINAGNNTFNSLTTDIANNTRFVGTIDIGAYEFNGATNANTSWTGATNTLWQEPTNWNNGLPDVNSNVTIPTGLGNYPTITNLNNATAFNVENQTGASVTVNAGKGLTVGNNVTNNGTITIHSDATSSGSLVVKGNASGNITYNRYVTDNWHTVGAPVLEQSIQTVAENNQVIQNGDNTKYAIAPYNNDIPSSNWEYETVANIASAGNFVNGKGYSMKRATAGTYSFTGSIENGDKTVILTDGFKNRWNLIANPYPNFLKFNNLADASSNLLLQNVAQINTNNLAVYIWDPATSGYKPYNHASTNLQYIAPGQAFFVNVKDGGGTFTFNKSLQTNHSGNVFARVKNEIFEMSLTVSDGKNVKSTEIKYLDNTTKGLDAGYDSEIFTAQDNSFNVYTHLLANNNNKAFALQCLPPTNFEEQIIPIGINADANTAISFTVEAKNIPSGMNIYLEDKQENTFTKLNDNGNYEIVLLEAQSGEGRFYLHTTSEVLSTEFSTALEQTKIWLSENRVLKISNLTSEKATIKLFDILGNEVFKTSFKTENNSSIKLPETITNAMYLVQLKTKKGIKSTKIFVD